MSLLDRLRLARLASLGAIAMSPSVCEVTIASRYGIALGQGPEGGASDPMIWPP